MSSTLDLPAAARRHLRCAEALAGLQRPEPTDAGYLCGLAAECAVKSLAETIPILRRDDIFYAHFPDLKNLVLNNAQGRQPQRLVQLLSAGHGYLGGWKISMRYEDDRCVASTQLACWMSDVRDTLALMED